MGSGGVNKLNGGGFFREACYCRRSNCLDNWRAFIRSRSTPVLYEGAELVDFVLEDWTSGVREK